MGDTGISYLSKVWNVAVGCSGDGCNARCYARSLHEMRHRAYAEGKKVPAQYAKPFCEAQCIESRLDEPLRWRKPQTVGVCFTGELFDRQVPDAFIRKVIRRVELCPQHTFVFLTKRVERMCGFLEGYFTEMINGTCYDRLPNAHFGGSITNQPDADERLPYLVELARQGWHTWVSYEPMLSAVDFGRCPTWERRTTNRHGLPASERLSPLCAVDGVIAGCESGPGARWPDPVEFFKSVRLAQDQCWHANVPFALKQIPFWPSKSGRVITDHMLDGKAHWDLPWAGEERVNGKAAE